MPIVGYILLILGIAAVGLLVLWMEPRNACCDCGSPATRLTSDGELECDACTERRLSGRAPRGG